MSGRYKFIDNVKTCPFRSGRHPSTIQRKVEKNTCSIFLQRKIKIATVIFKHKFWEHENHPVLIDNTEMYNQHLNYLYWNPVNAGFVNESWHWSWSSAIDYLTEKNRLLDIIILDGF